MLIHSDGHDGGAGLDAHIHTTSVENESFSHIETAAVQLGSHVLEVHKDHVFLNGQEFALVWLERSLWSLFPIPQAAQKRVPVLLLLTCLALWKTLLSKEHSC